MQLTKKDLITKLIDAARKAGNANPFALGFIAFDEIGRASCRERV